MLCENVKLKYSHRWNVFYSLSFWLMSGWFPVLNVNLMLYWVLNLRPILSPYIVMTIDQACMLLSSMQNLIYEYKNPNDITLSQSENGIRNDPVFLTTKSYGDFLWFLWRLIELFFFFFVSNLTRGIWRSTNGNSNHSATGLFADCALWKYCNSTRQSHIQWVVFI